MVQKWFVIINVYIISKVQVGIYDDETSLAKSFVHILLKVAQYTWLAISHLLLESATIGKGWVNKNIIS